MINKPMQMDIVELLINFWHDQKPEDPVLLNACWGLAERVLERLSVEISQVTAAPQLYRETIATAVDTLLRTDTVAQSLAQTLIKSMPSSSREAPGPGQHSRIYGHNNQVIRVSQSDRVQQIMHIHQNQELEQKLPSGHQIGTQEPRISLQLTQRSRNQMEVRALETSIMGETRIDVARPFTDDELIAVLKAMNASTIEPGHFTTQQRAALQRLGLPERVANRQYILRLIGQRLYHALFVGDIGNAFRVILNQAALYNTAAHLELRFDADSVVLARYPWELLHNEEIPLVHGAMVKLSRYVTFPRAVSELSLQQPLQVLYIAPRPSQTPYLPIDDDLRHMHIALDDLELAGKIHIQRVTPATLQTMSSMISEGKFQILHFDGHGSFARQCPVCNTRNYPHLTTCAECKNMLTNVAPRGFLAFENSERNVHWVDSSTLGALLSNRGLQLAVILACASGAVRGDTLFTGTGPALIHAGIPAVIVSQADIESRFATLFTQALYRQLALKRDIATAVNAGRDLLLPDAYWYLPALYLRGQ